MIFIYNSLPQENIEKNTFIYKRTYNFECTESFKQKLDETEWNEIETFQYPNEIFNTLLQKFDTLYDNCFLKKMNICKALG